MQPPNEYQVSPGSGLHSFIQPGTSRIAYAESGSSALLPTSLQRSSVSPLPRSFFFIVDGKLYSTTVATMLRLLWNEFIRNPPRPNEAYTRLGPTNHVVLPDFNIPSSVDGMRYPKWDNDFNRALWRHARNNLADANATWFDIEQSEADQRPTVRAMKYAAFLLAKLRGLALPLTWQNVSSVQLNESLVIPWNTSAPMPTTPEAYTLNGVEVWSPVSSFPGPDTTGGSPSNPGTGGSTGGGGSTGTGGSTGGGGGTTPGGEQPQAKSNTTMIIVVVAIALVLAIAALLMTRRRA